MLELTQDVNALLPLLIAVTVAHGFTLLTLHRSILTEKVARRGASHLSREYAVDPLEIPLSLFARRTEIVGLRSVSKLSILVLILPAKTVVGCSTCTQSSTRSDECAVWSLVVSCRPN